MAPDLILPQGLGSKIARQGAEALKVREHGTRVRAHEFYLVSQDGTLADKSGFYTRF